MLTRPAMLGLHLVAVLTVVLMGAAGMWQFRAYTDARSDVTAAALAGPAVPLGQVLGPDEALSAEALETRVVVSGAYAHAEEQFLVRDRESRGRQGYWVVSPLVVAGTSAATSGPSALLVVRGWQATSVPPPVPDSEVRVTGVLQPGEAGSASVGSDRVVDSVRIPALVNVVPFDLYSGFLVRTAEEPAPDDGLEAVAVPSPGASWSTGLRNLAYALQWWVFAGFAAFMWGRICSDVVSRRTTSGDTSRSPAGTVTR